MSNSPTTELYAALQAAFDHFNARLFENQLPSCLITLRSTNRVYGYHHQDRFISPTGEKIDELGLHPGFFTLRSTEEVLSTLVHEMVHHWQAHAGKPTPSNAHNREWANRMESIGLMPSKTGLPGGKKTGRSMSHYILPDGAFIATCQTLVDDGFMFPWLDRHLPSYPESQDAVKKALRESGIDYPASPAPIHVLPAEIDGKSTLCRPSPKKSPTRTKLTCAQCGRKAWVAQDTVIFCGVCQIEMTVV